MALRTTEAIKDLQRRVAALEALIAARATASPNNEAAWREEAVAWLKERADRYDRAGLRLNEAVARTLATEIASGQDP